MRKRVERSAFVTRSSPASVAHCTPKVSSKSRHRCCTWRQVVHTLDMQLYLRIALELHLKRLIVGGMERVFEIGRIFRNEGISTRHNPEFTMMELYQAFADYSEMIDITERLITQATIDATGSSLVMIGDDAVDLAQPWRRARMI